MTLLTKISHIYDQNEEFEMEAIESDVGEILSPIRQHKG